MRLYARVDRLAVGVTLWLVSIVAGATMGCGPAISEVTNAAQSGPLTAGAVVGRKLEGAGVFRLSVNAEGSLLLTVRNAGIDTVGEILDSEGRRLARAATWRGREGRYRLWLDRDGPGGAPHELRVSAVEDHVQGGRVLVQAEAVGDGSAATSKVVKAVGAFARGADEHLNYYLGAADTREAAVAAFRRGLRLLRGTDCHRLLADGHYELAAAYQSLDRLDAARSHYEKAGRYYKVAGDNKGLAATAGSLGLLGWREGDGEAAIEHLGRATRLRQREGQSFYLAQAYNNLGLVYRDRGEYTTALDYLEQALLIYEGDAGLRKYRPGTDSQRLLKKMGDGGGLHAALNTLNNMALVHDSIGNVDRAERYWRVFIELSAELTNPLKRPQAQHNLAALLHDRGRLDEALALLDDAVEEFDRLSNGWWHGLALTTLGEVYDSLGRHGVARSYYKQAVDVAGDSKRRRATILHQLGQTELAVNRPEKAEARFRKALLIHADLDRPLRAAKVRSDLADALARRGAVEDALKIQLAVVDQFRERNAVRYLGNALSHLGALQLQVGKLEAARTSLSNALAARRKASDALGEVETLRLLAMSFRGADSQHALSYARQATRKALALRPGAVAPTLRASFMATRRSAFELHLTLLMEDDRVEAGWQLAERVRARSLRDLVHGGGGEHSDLDEERAEWTERRARLVPLCQDSCRLL